MVNNLMVTFWILCCFNSCFSQNEEGELWYNNSYKLNIKKEQYITSDITDSLLYEEVKSFVFTYIKPTSLNNEEIAINIYVERLSDESVKYKISYLTEYYNKIKYRDIHQICLIEDRIVFINYNKIKEASIKKEIFYSLLRDRYPKEYKYLKDSYKEYKKKHQEVYPIIISSLEHDLPYWEIIIDKDGDFQRKVGKN